MKKSLSFRLSDDTYKKLDELVEQSSKLMPSACITTVITQAIDDLYARNILGQGNESLNREFKDSLSSLLNAHLREQTTELNATINNAEHTAYMAYLATRTILQSSQTKSFPSESLYRELLRTPNFFDTVLGQEADGNGTNE